MPKRWLAVACMAALFGASFAARPAPAETDAPQSSNRPRPARIVWELADAGDDYAPIRFPLTLRVGEQVRGLDEAASVAIELAAPPSGYVRAVFDVHPLWLPVRSGTTTHVDRGACCPIVWRDPFETSSEVASCSVGEDGRVCDPGETPEGEHCACAEGTHRVSPGLARDRICGSARRCVRSPRVRVLGNRRVRIWLGHSEAAVPVDVEQDPVDAVDVVVRPGPDRLVRVFTANPEGGGSDAIASIAVPAGHCAWLRMDEDSLATVLDAGSTRAKPAGSVACGTPWDAAVEEAARCGEAGAAGCRARALRTALDLCIAVTDDPMSADCAPLVAQIAVPLRGDEPQAESP